MWMIFLMVSMFVFLMGMAFYGWWHNKQVDKYNEWKKQQETLNNSPEGA